MADIKSSQNNLYKISGTARNQYQQVFSGIKVCEFDKDILPFDLPSFVSDPPKKALNYDPSSAKDTPAGHYFGISFFGNF